jgi:ABC-2 type transport system permease protein
MMEALLKGTSAWKYWVILSTRTQEDMAYRANYMVGALFRFLPLLTTIYLWYAVFNSPGYAGSGRMGKMTLPDIVSYYAIMFVARGFSSMPGMTRDISLDIKDGLLNRYLIRPISYFWYQTMYRLAHKLIFWLAALITFPPVFYLIREYLKHSPTVLEWVGFFISLIIAFWTGVLFSFLIGCLAFWFLEISTFLFVIMTMEFFLSGHLIPLNLMPSAIVHYVQWLPFAYEGYWPCMILIGKVQPDQMGTVLGIGFLWVGIFFVLVKLCWKWGTQRYSAVGG